MPAPAAIDAFGPNGLGLRVEFAWRDDRYEHTVKVITPQDETEGIPLACSLEGSPSDDWPASPAFQQLLVESRGPDRRIALLVGMSGTSHWSASIEPVVGATAFDFDVACRLRQTPLHLCATYAEVLPPEDSLDDAQCRHLTITAESPAEITRSASGWTIQPPRADRRLPDTVRWRYRLALE